MNEEKKKKKKDEEVSNKKIVDWTENPKFHLYFHTKEKIKDLEFEVTITRSESIWQNKIAKGIVNSMLGFYLFQYDKDNWRNQCLNNDKITFIPKNEISQKYSFQNIDPKGFLIMPCTYGYGISGPFTIMVKSYEKFVLEDFSNSKK